MDRACIYVGEAALQQTRSEFFESNIVPAMQQVDLSGIINSTRLPDITPLSGKRLSDYRMIPIIGSAEDGGHLQQLNTDVDGLEYACMDAAYGFCLLYKGKPNAIVSFSLSEDLDSLLIQQLQGVRKIKEDTKGHLLGKTSSRGLMPLDWRKALVDYVDAVGNKAGLSHIGIMCGRYHISARIKRVYSDFDVDKALEVYDGTAQRLGFTQSNDANWFRQVNRTPLSVGQETSSGSAPVYISSAVAVLTASPTE